MRTRTYDFTHNYEKCKYIWLHIRNSKYLSSSQKLFNKILFYLPFTFEVNIHSIVNHHTVQCTMSRTDEGQPRPKYIFNKCGTNIYFFTLQRFGPSPSLNFKSMYIIHHRLYMCLCTVKLNKHC